MKKVCTILGTRPEIIRLSRILPKLDIYTKHYLIHTGQNYTKSLYNIFFDDLRLRYPDISFDNTFCTFGDQIANTIKETEKVLLKIRPDAVLILGDTNSGLSSIVAARLGISVYHMEAGNRCFDIKVPEEVNRRIIDHSSKYNLPYTSNSRENLLKEGLNKTNIMVTGNPIFEVIKYYEKDIESSTVLDKLGLTTPYFLVTFHRSENVDIKERLEKIVNSLKDLSKKYKDYVIVCSVHPRTRSKLEKYNIQTECDNIRFCEPFNFFDFVKLEKESICIITDSGTVGEEACILNKPTIIIRDTTERPELIECGSAILTGLNTERVVEAVNTMLTSDLLSWTPPIGYLDGNVSNKVINILLGEEYVSQF